jgi:hypothetical protein
MSTDEGQGEAELRREVVRLRRLLHWHEQTRAFFEDDVDQLLELEEALERMTTARDRYRDLFHNLWLRVAAVANVPHLVQPEAADRWAEGQLQELQPANPGADADESETDTDDEMEEEQELEETAEAA